jgi:short-subunit dehydrogenase
MTNPHAVESVEVRNVQPTRGTHHGSLVWRRAGDGSIAFSKELHRPGDEPEFGHLRTHSWCRDAFPGCSRGRFRAGEAVRRRYGHLDVLINNAGYELAGALEELSPQEARAQFETNFFGVVRMVNAVLPSMRQQTRGHIINVGSLSGLSAIPFMGIHSASKFALEGYTEALRHEVKPFNIHVSLTEAGFLKTPMMTHRQTAGNRVSDYDQWRQKAVTAIRAYEEKGPGPELVAETLLEIVSSSRPRLRYLIGRQAKTVVRLRRFLPARLYEQGVRRTFSLDSAA